MRNIFFITIIIYASMSLACSSAQDLPNKSIQSIEQQQDLSSNDQKIISQYKILIDSINVADRLETSKKLKNFLVQANQIQNKKEREKIQMNIYLGTEMYQEAFELNKKQLQEGYSESKLFMHCELMQILEFPLEDVQKCQSKIAVKLKHELESTSKEDPNYDYLQWGYLLSMYKSGHLEYKKEMEKFIQSIEDETMKFQFQSSYELALEQRNALVNKQ